MIEIRTKSAKFTTACQRRTDKARLILKKGRFFNLNFPEICGHITRKEQEKETHRDWNEQYWKAKLSRPHHHKTNVNEGRKK